jgi:manganese/zinc/iron transport system permease protein
MGATAAGWLGTLIILAIVRTTRIKEDSAIGLILSVFFGLGLVLLTFIQKQPYASQAGLDKFLFGQAAALLEKDVITMAVMSAIVFLFLMLFWKEFKLISFDPDFSVSLGLPIRKLDVLLTTLLVIAIVLGLQTVGVVLMSAMVVAPAAAARQWTDRLGLMVLLSSLFGALSGAIGAIISGTMEHLPTGPAIVVTMSFLVLFSFLLAFNRGLVWKWIREQSNRRKLQIEAVLNDLYILAQQHESIDHGHAIEVLRTMSIGHGGVDRSLKVLKIRGWADQKSSGKWVLTKDGFKIARETFDSGAL